MKKVKIIHGWTEDELSLQGFHWESEDKNICVVYVHGMSGNIIENYFAEVLGDELTNNDIGFLYGHNRGYSHINDIRTKKIEKNNSKKTISIGQIYERFNESYYDIDLWVNEAKQMGYNKIILMGHSLGCNKVIHYFAKNNNNFVEKIILASPPDMVGLAKMKKYQPNYQEILTEAKKNVKNNKSRKIINSLLWDWYHISSQTFLDLFKDGCSADNLPLLRNPEKFDELSKIDVPIFAFMGEYDDIEIKSLKEDLGLIKEKAISCPDFDIEILKGANHIYENKEKELSEMIIKWIKN